MKFNNYLISLIVFFAFSAIALASFIFLTNEENPENSVATNNAMPKREIEENLTQLTQEDKLSQKMLLPDLQVEPLRDTYIVSRTDGTKDLRFPGTFANRGDGPLELVGTIETETGTTKTLQKIYKRDNTTDERYVGNFIFHEEHNHWHFENFVEFEIYSLRNGSDLDQQLASTGKITFCIHDYGPLDEDFPEKPRETVYAWCDKSLATQGISVGWADTYESSVPGQEIDIAGIPDGTYAFRVTVDPDNLILEKDESNNVTISYIKISGNDVEVVSSP